jgi:hypothetical protein
MVAEKGLPRAGGKPTLANSTSDRLLCPLCWWARANLLMPPPLRVDLRAGRRTVFRRAKLRSREIRRAAGGGARAASLVPQRLGCQSALGAYRFVKPWLFWVRTPLCGRARCCFSAIRPLGAGFRRRMGMARRALSGARNHRAKKNEVPPAGAREPYAWCHGAVGAFLSCRGRAGCALPSAGALDPVFHWFRACWRVFAGPDEPARQHGWSTSAGWNNPPRWHDKVDCRAEPVAPCGWRLSPAGGIP